MDIADTVLSEDGWSGLEKEAKGFLAFWISPCLRAENPFGCPPAISAISASLATFSSIQLSKNVVWILPTQGLNLVALGYWGRL